jgi:predicted alpha/beta-hydrolase family hydrolase
MTHPLMAAAATQLADRGIATLRFDFPYMAKGLRRPDKPAIAQAAVRAAVAEAHQRLPSLPLVAGGKSFGARMTSQAQAEAPMPGVRGLVFLGFPLHAAGKPSDERAAHLERVALPMLFLQGTRDKLADLGFLGPVVERLGPRATLTLINEGDHALRVPKRSGRTDTTVLGEALDVMVAWIAALPVRGA